MLNSDDLINKVKIYNKFLNPEKLNKAYDFAYTMELKRASVIHSVHPIEAKIFLQSEIRYATITTGLLHDTIEDIWTPETIKGEFGDEVADLVDGVTKICFRKYSFFKLESREL